MLKAKITGVGWVNARGAGCGREGQFQTGEDGPLPKLSRRDVFLRPFPRFGKMDSYSRLGASAISFALRDAGLGEWTDTREIAIIASTVYGCLNADEDYYDTITPVGGRLASPNLFVYALPNTYLGEAAIHFGLTGPSFVLCESELSGLRGMSMAISSIASGEYETVIAGICDAGAPPFLAMIGKSVPGALFLVLQEETLAGPSPYGTLVEDGSGAIFFNGKRVEDLNNLAGMCTDMQTRKGDSKDK